MPRENENSGMIDGTHENQWTTRMETRPLKSESGTLQLRKFSMIDVGQFQEAMHKYLEKLAAGEAAAKQDQINK
jgi:hypothetical protein